MRFDGLTDSINVRLAKEDMAGSFESRSGIARYTFGSFTNADRLVEMKGWTVLMAWMIVGK